MEELAKVHYMKEISHNKYFELEHIGGEKGKAGGHNPSLILRLSIRIQFAIQKRFNLAT